MTDLKALHREFVDRFAAAPVFFRAPGRVNLIGDHTDYSGGFVMPAAIQFQTVVGVAPRTDRRLRVWSAHFGESIVIEIPQAFARPAGSHGEQTRWIDYVAGVARGLERSGLVIPGADLLIHGDVPLGAGLSSSASLEVATGLALASIASRSTATSGGVRLSKVTLARISQEAENDYVGMRCGIMDQFASVFGRVGHAIKIDCRSLEHEYLPLDGGHVDSGTAIQLLVCNTMVRHQHASGEYNRRREQCEEGLAELKRSAPQLTSLRDVSAALLDAREAALDPVIYRRCRHVVSENERVQAAAAALKQRDLEQFGRLMRLSHESLRDDYEVSCEELDLMVRLAESIEGVYGARMTGGGFGGCTVNVVRAEAVASFRALMTAGYAAATGKTPDIYVCEAAGGAGPVELDGNGNVRPERGARSLDLQSEVHRRYDPLSGDWVLVSPHRYRRPWQGQTEEPVESAALSHDPGCYLCPGNARAGGLRNPDYTSVYVFDNDFPALIPEAPGGGVEADDLLRARSETGICRVICYSPLHNVTLGEMPAPAIRRVIDAWSEEYQKLGSRERVNAVTIFENRGAMMGASNPHPHGQIWANETVPGQLLREMDHLVSYRTEHGSCLLCDYAALELERGERMVCSNEHFVAMVPFWATWPFETLVMPRSHVSGLDGLDGPRRDGFARVLKELTGRYDRLFNVTFPYTMGMHQRPTDQREHAEWHLHAHFYPPLLRSASVRKFMVGYEMLAGPQRDMTPEDAAAMLRK